MNSSTIYDRKLFKDEMKKIYNNHTYLFQQDNNLLSNMILIPVLIFLNFNLICHLLKLNFRIF